jgi:pimeloyl-ACP methyl ester carboxylesterase
MPEPQSPFESTQPGLRREARVAHRRLYGAIFLLCLVVVAAFAWPFARVRLQALAVLDRVADSTVPMPLAWIASGPVTTTEITLPLPSGAVRARLYTPVHHPGAPAIMVIHGVHYLGIDEPRLVAFASAMSACGLRVLTPELPDIKDYHVGAHSIASIGDAAVWLDHHNGDRPVGVIGLSFSGSLSLLAAAEPQYRPDIKFVVAAGSEAEMSRVANYYITGKDPRPDGSMEILPPHEYGALVLEYAHLEDFVPAADLEAVRLVLREHLCEDVPAERAAFARLTSTQADEARQLMDTTSPITRRELAESNARHLEAMASVSPQGHLSQLTAQVYLLHGEADNVIPSAETEWLEREIPRKDLKAVLISPVISHLDLDDKGPTFADQWRLVHFFARILQAAESR